MEDVKIVSDGKLLRTRWVYDESKAEGSYDTNDVTDVAPQYLFDACTLDQGVRLKDIFELLDRHIEVYKRIMGNLVEDVVSEGLQPYTGTQAELGYTWSFIGT
jgi:hypothetical protein